MKQIETPWEKRNIGIDSCEITVFEDDNEEQCLNSILTSRKYPYMVVKLPVCRPELVKKLEKNNWNYIETQFTLVNPLVELNSLNIKDSVREKLKRTSYKIMNNDEIKSLFVELEKGSFNTDRIYLDSSFEKSCASQRYINWIKDLIAKDSLPCKVVYEGNIIGFFIFGSKITQNCGQVHLILAGLYKKYIGQGLGILMETSVLLYAKENGAESIITGCSSNNIPVLKIMFNIGYKLQTLSTVMVKHNNIT